MSDQVLHRLSTIIAERRHADAADSYVASLFAKGLNKTLEKVGEEAIEVILAAKDSERSGDADPLVYEVADLWFHCLVALAHCGTDASAVLGELERRFTQSGLAEKAARGVHPSMTENGSK